MKAMVRTLQQLSTTLLLGAALLLSPQALADQFVAYGDYEIHYNAFNSSFLQPDIAQEYGLQRGKRRAMVNVSVLKREGDEKKPVSALVRGQASNLLEQTQEMEFKKVDEGQAIYYIGAFGFSDDMQMRISLSIQPDPNQPAYDLQFVQKFYAD